MGLPSLLQYRTVLNLRLGVQQKLLLSIKSSLDKVSPLYSMLSLSRKICWCFPLQHVIFCTYPVTCRPFLARGILVRLGIWRPQTGRGQTETTSASCTPSCGKFAVDQSPRFPSISFASPRAKTSRPPLMMMMNHPPIPRLGSFLQTWAW